MGKLRNMTAIYLLKGDSVLLLFRQKGRVVSEVWTGSAGGHFEEAELNDARACVLRELKEETGLSEKDVENLSLRYVTLRNVQGEIRQNYYFFADLKEDAKDALHSNEGKLAWFLWKDLDALEMPFTARYVTRHYDTTGRFNKKQYAGVANENGVTFIEMTKF